MSARQFEAIFLDDGGVMNDNTLRAPEWRRLVGEFLAPRLGGSREAWGRANQVVFDRQWRRYEGWLDARDDVDYEDFLGSAAERERWIREMCLHTSVDAPPPEECVSLAIETEAFVLPRVRAGYRGAARAVRSLHASGYRLSTASGGTSRELEGYVGSLGVRDLFGDKLYGPDLVLANKAGPEFYRRIFASEGIDPAAALVVDDSPHAVCWIAEAGATAVLVAHDGCAAPEAWFTVRSLEEVPDLLERR